MPTTAPAAKSFLSHLRAAVTHPAFLATLAAPLAGAGINAVADHRRNLESAKAKTVSFRTMLDLHPVLKSRDPKQVALVFSSLHNANPGMVNDPYVAGALVHNVIESQSGLGEAGGATAIIGAVERLSGIRAQQAQALRATSSGTPWAGKIEGMVGEFGKSLGKAMDEEPAKRIARANEIIDDRDRKLKNLGEALKARAAEMRAEEQDLRARAQQIYDIEQGGHTDDASLNALFKAMKLG